MASQHVWMVLICSMTLTMPVPLTKGQTVPGGVLLDLHVSPAELNATEGAMAKFVCSAEVAGPPENLTLRWIWSDAHLDNSSYRIMQSVQISSSPDGQTSFKNNTLQILDIIPADEGTYICQASYEDHHKQLTVWLHIIDKENSSLWWISVPAICVPAMLGAVILYLFYKRRKDTADNTCTNTDDLHQEIEAGNPDWTQSISSTVMKAHSPDERVTTVSSTDNHGKLHAADKDRSIYDTCTSQPHYEWPCLPQVGTRKSIPEGLDNPSFGHYKKNVDSRKPKVAVSTENLTRRRWRDSGYVSTDDVREKIKRQETDAHILKGDFKHLQTQAHEKLIEMSPRKQLQTNIVSKSFASGIFDEKGGHLSIPEADVKMFIPPYAIKANCQEEIYIYLEKNPHCDHQEMIGPVLHCGPPGFKFEAQVIFSLPLSTSISVDRKKIIPMRTETDIGEATNWKPISETEDAFCFIEGNTCTFCVDHFTGHGTSCNDAQLFLIGAYRTPSIHTRGQFNFHIRCWKNDDRVTRSICSEEAHHHCLGRAAVHMEPNMANLHLDIEVRPGWTQVKPTHSSLQISYAELMSGRPVQTEFEFKINSSDVAEGFACCIIAYQVTHPGDSAELHISSPDSPEVLQEQRREESLLPPEVFKKICQLMDSESNRLDQGPNAGGWQSFAKQVGIPPDCIIANKPNEERRPGATPLGASSAAATSRQGPTANILAIWESRCIGQGLPALQSLYDTFHRLGRLDVCRLLFPIIEHHPQRLEEHPRELPGSVQETSTYTCQTGNREEMTLQTAADQIPSNELYETDGTSGIESIGSTPHSQRMARYTSSGRSQTCSSTGSYCSSNSI